MDTENKNIKNTGLQGVTVGLLIAAFLIVGFNTLQISQLSVAAPVTGNVISNTQSSNPAPDTGTAKFDMLPTGNPEIYGNELGVSFDDVSANNPQKANEAIAKLGTLDRQLTLNEQEMKRYIEIGSQISCEYCCGAKSIIFADGKAACGCAHSFAMRGLAKYLLKNHPSEYTNDQILTEMAKWKTLFFPGKAADKEAALKAKGIELNYINLQSNNYRGIEKQATGSGSGSGMVGGC